LRYAGASVLPAPAASRIASYSLRAVLSLPAGIESALIRLWENIHYQYRNGVFDEAEFTAARNTWRLSNPLLRATYCRQKQAHSLSPAFVDEMDRLAPGSCDAKVNVDATQSGVSDDLRK
jgi:hypothetical protein